MRTLQSRFPGDVVLGWLTFDGHNRFAPPPREVHDFAAGDKIIVLTRRYISDYNS